MFLFKSTFCYWKPCLSDLFKAFAWIESRYQSEYFASEKNFFFQTCVICSDIDMYTYSNGQFQVLSRFFEMQERLCFINNTIFLVKKFKLFIQINLTIHDKKHSKIFNLNIWPSIMYIFFVIRISQAQRTPLNYDLVMVLILDGNSEMRAHLRCNL